MPEDDQEASGAAQVSQSEIFPTSAKQQSLESTTQQKPATPDDKGADDCPKPEPEPCWQRLDVEFTDSEGQASTVPFVMTPLGINYCNSWPLAVTKVKLGGHAEELGVKEGWMIKKIAEHQLVEADVQIENFVSLANDFYQQVQKLPKRTDLEKKKRKERKSGLRIAFKEEEEDVTPVVMASVPEQAAELPSVVPTSDEAEKRPPAGDLRATASSDPLDTSKDGASEPVPERASASTLNTLEVVFQKGVFRQWESASEGEKVTITFVRKPLGFKFANDEGTSPVAVTAVSPGSHAEELGVKLKWKLVKVGGIMVSDFSDADAEVVAHLDGPAFEKLQNHFKEKATALPTKEVLEAAQAAASRMVLPAAATNIPEEAVPVKAAASIPEGPDAAPAASLPAAASAGIIEKEI